MIHATQPSLEAVPMSVGTPMSEDISTPLDIEIPLQLDLPGDQVLYAAVVIGGMPFEGQKQIAERIATAWNAWIGTATHEIVTRVETQYHEARALSSIRQITSEFADLSPMKLALAISRMNSRSKTEDAIQRACGDLPEGWTVRIDMENGAGIVELYDDELERIEFPADSGSIAQDINRAIDRAIEITREDARDPT